MYNDDSVESLLESDDEAINNALVVYQPDPFSFSDNNTKEETTNSNNDNEASSSDNKSKKGIINTIKIWIKRFIEWIKHLFRQASLWVKKYYYKFMVWWNKKKITKQVLEDAIAIYNVPYYEEKDILGFPRREELPINKINWEYKLPPNVLIDDLIRSFKDNLHDIQSLSKLYTSIENIPAKTKQLIEDIRNDEQYKLASNPGQMDPVIYADKIHKFMCIPKCQMKEIVDTIFSLGTKCESDLYKSLKQFIKDNDEELIDLIKLQIKCISSLITNYVKKVMKVAKYYSTIIAIMQKYFEEHVISFSRKFTNDNTSSTGSTSQFQSTAPPIDPDEEEIKKYINFDRLTLDSLAKKKIQLSDSFDIDGEVTDDVKHALEQIKSGLKTFGKLMMKLAKKANIANNTWVINNTNRYIELIKYINLKQNIKVDNDTIAVHNPSNPLHSAAETLRAHNVKIYLESVNLTQDELAILNEAEDESSLASVHREKILSGYYLNSLLGFFIHAQLDENKLQRVLKVVDKNLKTIDEAIKRAKASQTIDQDSKIAYYVYGRAIVKCLISTIMIYITMTLITKGIHSFVASQAPLRFYNEMPQWIRMLFRVNREVEGMTPIVVATRILSTALLGLSPQRYLIALKEYQADLRKTRTKILIQLKQAKDAHKAVRESLSYNTIECNRSYINTLSLKYNIV